MDKEKNNDNKKDNNKIASLSKEELSIKEKARLRVKNSQKVQYKKENDKISNKAKKSVSKSNDSLFIEVPLRKDVKGIPRAKLDVFSKHNNDINLSHELSKEKLSDNKYWKQGEIEFAIEDNHKNNQLPKKSEIIDNEVESDISVSRKINKKDDSRPSNRMDNRVTNRVPSKTSSLKGIKPAPKTSKDKKTSNKEVDNKKNVTKTNKAAINRANSKKSTSKKSASNKSASNKSASKKSASNKSASNKSTSNKSASNKSASNKSASNKSTSNKSTSNKSASNKSTNNKSTNNKSTNNKSTNNKSTNNKSTNNKSTNNKSKSNKSTNNKSKSNESLNRIITLLDDKQNRKALNFQTGEDIKKRRQRKIDIDAIERRHKNKKKSNSLLFRILNYKINSKFNIKLYYLLLLIIILALIIHLYIVSFDIPFLDNNKVDKSLNSIEIVEPVHENSFDSDFTFVGNNLKDLDSLIINGNEDIALSKSNQIINLDDDNLSNQYIVINIEQGLNATQIATMLEANEICKKDDFINYVIDNNYDTQLQSGKYVIEKNTSVSEIVDSIISNDSTIVNIYPASTIEQIDNLLTSRQLIKSGEFLQACTQVCAEKGLAFVEGWFSPATYKISNDFDVKLLARTMLDNTLEILSPYLKDIANAGLSINEIIIIASLIQGETQDNQQMPIISSVIHNRLKKDMPLGIDATTRYEIGDWSGELTSDVLDEITPYNTRRQKGLPPSGICLSSSSALTSAIFPKSTDFLYYIHDEAGNLITALTYDEHLKNIEERDNS